MKESKAKIIEKKNNELNVNYREQILDIVFEGSVYDEKTKKNIMVPFTAKEIDAFYAILGIMNDEGTDFIDVPNSFIKEYTNDRKKTSSAEYDEQLFHSQQKLSSLFFKRNDDTSYVSIPFFKLFIVDKEKQRTMAQANDGAKDLILHLLKDYTSFKMEELSILRRVCSKILYVKLKAVKEKGIYEVDRESFEKYMNVQGMASGEIKRIIIDRAIEELGFGQKGKKIFRKLKVEYIKDPNDKRRWYKLKFTFDKQLKTPETIHVSEQLKLEL